MPNNHEKNGKSNKLDFLFDSSVNVNSIDINDCNEVNWIDALKTMLKIRRTEELFAEKSVEGLINTPIHLSIGQEAISAGIALNLSSKDFVFGNHRSHGHYIAMGGDIQKLISEVLGKSSGCSKGMGGSMHIVAKEKGFIGSVPIVGGTIPIAVGAGLHLNLNTKDSVGVAFFGDGSVEEGVFHESLNFASTHSIPVFFICENNQFSSHMHLKQRQPDFFMSRFAKANKIEYETIEGNDISAVYKSSKKLLKICRMYRRPVFLEAVTYRWKAHVGPTEDIEIGYGRRVDLHLWKRRDPIKRLIKVLEQKQLIKDSQVQEIDNKIKECLKDYFDIAMKQDYPEPSQLFSGVYLTI